MLLCNEGAQPRWLISYKSRQTWIPLGGSRRRQSLSRQLARYGDQMNAIMRMGITLPFVGFYSTPAQPPSNDFDDAIKNCRFLQQMGSERLKAAILAPVARAKLACCKMVSSTTNKSDSGADATNSSSGKAPKQFMFNLGIWTVSLTFD